MHILFSRKEDYCEEKEVNIYDKQIKGNKCRNVWKQIELLVNECIL